MCLNLLSNDCMWCNVIKIFLKHLCNDIFTLFPGEMNFVNLTHNWALYEAL